MTEFWLYYTLIGLVVGVFTADGLRFTGRSFYRMTLLVTPVWPLVLGENTHAAYRRWRRSR